MPSTNTSDTAPATTGNDDPERVAENELDYAVDEQTGKVFRVAREKLIDRVTAWVSAVYQLGALAFLLWLLLDTWSGRNLLLDQMGYSKEMLASPTFRLMAFVALGGALGGVVSGLRSIISWHSERDAYGASFIWKDLSLPLVGAALGLIVYMALRGGVGMIDGNFSLNQKGVTPTVTGFAVAWLAGFASWQVFRWLDAQANRLFSVAKDGQTVVPDLSGKTLADAKAALAKSKLSLGAMDEQETDACNHGKVLEQSLRPKSVVTRGTTVDITLGKKG